MRIPGSRSELVRGKGWPHDHLRTSMRAISFVTRMSVVLIVMLIGSARAAEPVQDRTRNPTEIAPHARSAQHSVDTAPHSADTPPRSPERAARAYDPVSGLDSLASATLERALEYMQISPAGLGFDKKYVEDDTFRLSIVDAILDDPLRLLEWQAETITKLRRILEEPDSLLAWVGETIDAPGNPPQPVFNGATRGDARNRSRDALDGGTAAEAVARFIEEVRAAQVELDRAFARIDPTLRDQVQILAPAIWGDPEHPLDPIRKGMLHFELGAPADTTLELKENLVLDAAALLDRSALTRSAQLYVRALLRLTEAPAIRRLLRAGSDETNADPPDVDGSERLPSAFTEIAREVEGEITGAWPTPWGWLVIGGAGPNRYSAGALEQIAFVLEAGGNDVYEGRAASAVGGLLRPFSAVFDRGGDDLYSAGERPYALGGAHFGVAALIDLRGNDVYRGDDGSLGASCFGVGLLYDGSGKDFFEGRNLSQGAGAFGIGILRSAAKGDAPPGQELQPDRGYEAGLLPVPGTGAMVVRADENDVYVAARQAQGFASTFGFGLLSDDAGNDVYRAGGLYLHAPLLPNDFQSLSQGFAIGFRPRAAGGVGILLDESGNDFYDAEVYAQGTSYWYSLGLLFDGAGNDRYLATQYAQGAGVHLSIGSLWDRGGDDHYVSKLGVTQGTAHDLSVGMLRDESGNDYYTVSDGQGVSIVNSVALFLDEQGDDFYATPRGGQGTAGYRRGFSGTGIFLDLEGTDQYVGDGGGRDGAAWAANDFSIGIDLDRDIVIPGEVVPEITLTAADSARAVEELFETASLWEVGSARETVRRARMALIAKGMEAVIYATGADPRAAYVDGDPIATETELVYRTVRELADAYPDSMAARILPRLRDPDVRVQKNVIRLLGELKRKEARQPLEAMLRDRRQEQHWTRILSALGELGEPSSRMAVRPFLNDSQERRRIAALAALRSLRDTTAVPILIPLLDDEQFTVRSAAMATIGSFGAAAAPDVIARLSEVRREEASGGARTAGTREAEPATSPRIALIRILGNIAGTLKDAPDPASLQTRAAIRLALLEELSVPSPDAAGARAAAISALYRLGEPEMREFIRVRMLDESDPLVKRTFEWEEARAIQSAR